MVRFPLNAHNLQLWFTNNYPRNSLLITNACFSQSYTAYSVAEITFLKLFTANVFIPATFESSGKWRKFAVPANISCATAAMRFCTLIKSDYLKTDDLYIFLLHCAPGRLSWPPKLRNKLFFVIFWLILLRCNRCKIYRYVALPVMHWENSVEELYGESGCYFCRFGCWWGEVMGEVSNPPLCSLTCYTVRKRIVEL
jgi:hypothetical protein